MPGPASEPEKYSIDEIMERLTAAPSDEADREGTLVTRADGTQALRVKKRKRRSRQPRKEEDVRARKVKMISLTAGLLGVALAGLALGVFVIYSNSAPFRKTLSSQLSAYTGAGVKLHQFRMNPTGVNAAEVRLTWPQDQILKEARFSSIKGGISLAGIFKRKISGEEMIAAEGEMKLSAPSSTNASQKSHSPASPLHFDRYGVRRLDLHLGQTAVISGTEASLYPEKSKGASNIRFHGGTIKSPHWPSLLLDRAFVELRGKNLEIPSISLFSAKNDRGRIHISGTLPQNPGKEAFRLAIKAEHFPLTGLIGGGLEAFLSGRIDTKSGGDGSYLSIELSSESPVKAALEWKGSPATPLNFQSFPFLHSLAKATEDTWYQHPVFLEETEGLILRDQDSVAIENLKLISRGRMAIKGSLKSGPGRILSGALRLGLSENVLLTSPNRRLDQVFGPPSEGFRWITLEISGTIDAPEDNFQKILAGAEETKKSGDSYKSSTFEELTQPKGQ